MAFPVLHPAAYNCLAKGEYLGQLVHNDGSSRSSNLSTLRRGIVYLDTVTVSIIFVVFYKPYCSQALSYLTTIVFCCVV